ncbi:hypothetical protein GLW08_06360 [Pontibacillus yanchengensis]|uniref:Uncharacterized protein n=2 Tax=Pontibacillus yanchengensis TaxID=462910 RepID=A0ACC7VFS1_9BACI|nr:YheC/YheD family protein [Pontibacillus yanchengensis]MYL32380.1 hypothetical protein [Pontibacillus yanchengensis]MYL52960.1 hypothetical protein [Pontibacillus yanchengensis]
MESFHFHLQSYRSHKNRVIVPKQVYPAFKQAQTIKYGIKQASIEIMTHQKDDDILYISEDLVEEVHLLQQRTISCYVQGPHIILQPLLGVFTAGFQEEEAQVLGERTPVFESMAMTGQSYGFDTIFFGYQHINWDNQTIHGWVFSDGEWKDLIYPIPYVIYDRIPNRKVEHHPSIEEAKQKLQEHTIWFNSGFFNKWKTYDQLIQTGQVAHLLPPTVLHPSQDKIAEMLDTHKSIYIKPIHGSKGSGIKKCTTHSDSAGIECMYYDQDKKVHQRYHQLSQMLKQQFPNGLYGYIAQPEIPLKSKRSSPMDYRVHANKNENNEWEVTAVCTKFAGKGSLTTHVKRGGSLHTLDELFDDKESQTIYKKLERSALLVSKALDHKSSSPIGELGFDFGIDEEGKVWLFEANSKPGYALYDHPAFQKEQSVILSYPYRYAKHFYLSLLAQ